MTRMSTAEGSVLADQLERSLRGGAWHGPALTEVLSGVDASAARRVLPGAQQSIFQQVAHVTYWLERAHQRLQGIDGPDLDGDDWPEVERGDEAWQDLRRALERAHDHLRTTVSALSPDQLDDVLPHCDATARGLVLGILQHNAYHAGQVMQMVKMGART